MGTATISVFGVRDAPFAYNVLRVRIAEEETDVILGGHGNMPAMSCVSCALFFRPPGFMGVCTPSLCMYAFRRTMDSVCSPFWWFPSVLHANSRVPDRHTACPSSLSCPLSQTLDVAIKRHRRRIPLLLHLRGTMQSSISFFVSPERLPQERRVLQKSRHHRPELLGYLPSSTSQQMNPTQARVGADET